MIPDIWAQHVLLEVNGKRPIRKNWRHAIPTPEQVKEHHGNLGWIIPPSVLVVDCDHRHGGEVAYRALVDQGYLSDAPSVRTPNGIHTYLQLPDDVVRFPTKLRAFQGIDFLGHGHYVVIPPSTVGERTYEWLKNPFPLTPITSLLCEHGRTQSQQEEDDLSWATANVDEATLVSWLKQIDPGADYHTWIRVGFALYHWDHERGLVHWQGWSKSQSELHHKYKPRECEAKWRTFASSTERVTVATIRYLASEALSSKIVKRLERPVTPEQRHDFLTKIDASPILTQKQKDTLVGKLALPKDDESQIPEEFKDGVYDALAKVFLLRNYGPLSMEDFQSHVQGICVETVLTWRRRHSARLCDASLGPMLYAG